MKNTSIIVLFGVSLFLLFGRKKHVVPSSYNGFLANNPGNIRLTNINWQGKIPNAQNKNKAFEEFTSMTFGILALMQNMKFHYTQGQNTIQKLISVWAPPSENNTTLYIQNVSKWTGISPTQPFTWNLSNVVKISRAITTAELGQADTNKIDISQYTQAYNKLS